MAKVDVMLTLKKCLYQRLTARKRLCLALASFFCSSCREVVALKKSVIELHIASQKHKERSDARRNK